MPANELFSPAEIGAVAGFPVKSVYKVIEQRSPNGLVIRRNGQALRGTGGRGGNQTLTNFINSGSPRLLQPTARATTILVAPVLQPQVPLSAVHMPCLGVGGGGTVARANGGWTYGVPAPEAGTGLPLIILRWYRLYCYQEEKA